MVSNAVTGEFDSAKWNGEPLSEEEVRERRLETKCPNCGRDPNPENPPVIQVGGFPARRP